VLDSLNMIGGLVLSAGFVVFLLRPEWVIDHAAPL
jgi:hypothetical protein